MINDIFSGCIVKMRYNGGALEVRGNGKVNACV